MALEPVKARDPLDATFGVAAGAAGVPPAAGAASGAPEEVAAASRDGLTVVNVTAWHPEELVSPAMPVGVTQGVPLLAPAGAVTVTEVRATQVPFTMAPAWPLDVVQELEGAVDPELVVVSTGTHDPLIISPTVPLLVVQTWLGDPLLPLLEHELLEPEPFEHELEPEPLEPGTLVGGLVGDVVLSVQLVWAGFVCPMP